MKQILIALFTLASVQGFTYEGDHPGLQPRSENTTSQYSNENSVYSDIQTRGSVYTKYGTSMTAEEYKEAAQNRRAARDKSLEGGPSSGAPAQEAPVY